MKKITPESISASQKVAAEKKAVLVSVVDQLAKEIGVAKEGLLDLLKTVDDDIWLDMMELLLKEAPASFTEWEHEFYGDVLQRQRPHLSYKQHGVFWKTFAKLFRSACAKPKRSKIQ